MCLTCKTSSPYIMSTKIHGKHPIIQFRKCKHCKTEVQGSLNFDGTFHEFSTSVYKGGSNLITLRLSDLQLTQFQATGKTSREIFELGLEMYKNSQTNLTN